MPEQRSDAIRATERLREALEQTAAALARPNLEALLACEALIETALGGLPAPDHLTGTERDALGAELERARGALMRCRRLGTALGEFIRVSFDAQGRGAGYGPRDAAAFACAGQALDARV